MFGRAQQQFQEAIIDAGIRRWNLSRALAQGKEAAKCGGQIQLSKRCADMVDTLRKGNQPLGG